MFEILCRTLLKLNCVEFTVRNSAGRRLCKRCDRFHYHTNFSRALLLSNFPDYGPSYGSVIQRELHSKT